MVSAERSSERVRRKPTMIPKTPRKNAVLTGGL